MAVSDRKLALLSVCFCAGLLGALANSLAAWLFGQWGIPALAGVKLAPSLTLAWLYPRLIWGGLWGLLFFAMVHRPRWRRHWIRKGLWLSILPSLVQLLWVFPQSTPFGMLGLKLGALAPLFVLFYNFVWGFFTAISARLLWGRG